jgi:hypothetical protein
VRDWSKSTILWILGIMAAVNAGCLVAAVLVGDRVWAVMSLLYLLALLFLMDLIHTQT